MLKYTTTQVTFREIPDEIALCINISGCPIKCPDCHSKELWEEVGSELTTMELDKLIEQNAGISCICFMGGDKDIPWLIHLASYIKSAYPKLRTAWYSGRDSVPESYMGWFRYVKVGPYIKKFGGLDKSTTNQKLFKIISSSGAYQWKFDITNKFWKKN